MKFHMDLQSVLLLFASGFFTGFGLAVLVGGEVFVIDDDITVCRWSSLHPWMKHRPTHEEPGHSFTPCHKAVVPEYLWDQYEHTRLQLLDICGTIALHRVQP